LRERLGKPLVDGAIEEARVAVVASGAVEAALGVARDHAAKAVESIHGADRLDRGVVDHLANFVDGLVTRGS
jgi:hypothetical protein